MQETINATAPRGPRVTSRIGYYSDDNDPHADEDPVEIRERAFTAWRKHGARCNTATLRLAREYAQDLGFHAAGRAIRSALESRGRS
jgi:ribosomal protein S16